MPMHKSVAVQGSIGSGGNGMAANAIAPREIGYLDRLSGIESSLSVLVERLGAFHGRLHSEGSDAANKSTPLGGIDNLLAASEHHLRCCHAMIEDINSKF